jgi:hypothetical protein
MDIAEIWRNVRGRPDQLPLPGAHLETPPEPGITISVTQQCQLVLPSPDLIADEVTVTVTSLRPGVAAEVSIFANFNNLGGSYQGPSTEVGRASFTATRPHVDTAFVVLPGRGGPVGWDAFLGIAAEAIWADGAPQSVALTYEELPKCNTGLFGPS